MMFLKIVSEVAKKSYLAGFEAGRTPEPEKLPVVEVVYPTSDVWPTDVYADGGVIGKNPSPIGGTWCYIWTKEDKATDNHCDGSITAAEMGTPTVTNNQTELLAVVRAMENLPKNWKGTVWTDSRCTIARMRSPKSKMRGIPEWLEREVRLIQKRMPHARYEYISGHPTQNELAAGKSHDGHPVSRWNATCDHINRATARKITERSKE